MKINPLTKQAHQLFLDGSIALAQIESNGIKIDVPYLEKAIEQTGIKIKDIEREMRSDKVYKIWKKRFGENLKMGSRDQLGTVLFDIMEFPCKERTATGKPKTDGTALDVIDLKFVRDFIHVEKLKKALATNLHGIRNETIDSFLHPSFNLSSGHDEDAGGARTYRSSSALINFQNLPVRDAELNELVRRSFIPRGKKRRIGEKDFKGIEVGVAAAYNFDPVLIEYVKDPSKDMHRDRAMDCFFLEKEEVNKKTRHVAKNMFVFPQFYGSFYVDCARSMWEEMERLHLTIEGTNETVKDRLRKNGIKSLGKCDPDEKPVKGTFEYHIKEVEDHFWGKVFKVYAKWKKDFYNQYLKKGYFDLYTGFRIFGHANYRRNQVVNYPVQGAAFHCLLWCLIRLQKWMNKNRMESVIIGQIHDSILSDYHEDECDYIIEKALRIMQEDLPREWDWINVPMTVEIEIAPPGKSWYEKKPLELAL